MNVPNYSHLEIFVIDQEVIDQEVICYTGVGFKQNKLLSSLPSSSIVEATPIKEEKCRSNQCVTLRYTMDDPRGLALNFKLKVTQGLCGTHSSNCESLCDQGKRQSLNNTVPFKKCKVISCLEDMVIFFSLLSFKSDCINFSKTQSL